MKIGIFGGSFDPIHNGHLFIAEAARESAGLDRIVFVPTRGGAHRLGPMGASAQDRSALVRLAIASNPAFAFDDSDLADDATGYTADLLPRLRARYPLDELAFLAGSDSLVRSRWQRLDEILDLVSAFLIAPRDTIDASAVTEAFADVCAERRAKVRVLDLPLVEESATLIRARIVAGLSIRYLVPEPVYRSIADRGLYR